MYKGIYTVFAILILATVLDAATFRTKNFVVTAQDPQVAEQMAHRAEFLREDLSQFWIGKKLPNWYKRCKIKIRIGDVAPGGQTSFVFNNGEVYGWDMDIQGTTQRIYDSVLPHEMTHMILASYFRCPVPRWADEGAATFTESNAERDKYQNMLLKFLRTQKGIPLDKLFEMQEYPNDPLPLYAQGFSITEFLIRQRGPRYFVYFIEKDMEGKKPLQALIQECYGYETLRELQRDWVAWVSEGSPAFVGSNLIHSETQPMTAEPPIQLVNATTESVPKESAANQETTYAEGSESVGPKRLRPQPNLLIWTSSDMRNQP